MELAKTSDKITVKEIKEIEDSTGDEPQHHRSACKETARAEQYFWQVG